MTPTTPPPPKKINPDDMSAIIADLKRRITKLERLKNSRLPPGTLVHMLGCPDPTSGDVATDGYEGFLFCDGGIHLISDFPDLAAVISNTFGGNGTTTFATPNLNQDIFGSGGKFLFGDTIIESGGAKAHSHDLGDEGYAAIYPDVSVSQIRARMITGVSAYSSTRRVPTSAQTNVSTSGETAGVGLNGRTKTTSMPVPWFGAPLFIKY